VSEEIDMLEILTKYSTLYVSLHQSIPTATLHKGAKKILEYLPD
jgi:hypothetical protein